jgi:hypothetical protein
MDASPFFGVKSLSKNQELMQEIFNHMFETNAERIKNCTNKFLVNLDFHKNKS